MNEQAIIHDRENGVSENEISGNSAARIADAYSKIIKDNTKPIPEEYKRFLDRERAGETISTKEAIAMYNKYEKK